MGHDQKSLKLNIYNDLQIIRYDFGSKDKVKSPQVLIIKKNYLVRHVGVHIGEKPKFCAHCNSHWRENFRHIKMHRRVAHIGKKMSTQGSARGRSFEHLVLHTGAKLRALRASYRKKAPNLGTQGYKQGRSFAHNVLNRKETPNSTHYGTDKREASHLIMHTGEKSYTMFNSCSKLPVNG